MGKISAKKKVNRIYKKSDENFFTIKKIRFDRDKMILTTHTRDFIINLKNVSSKLYHANRIQKEAYRIICSGYGINWPLIDEDLTIKGLISKAEKVI
ncbi:MAG: DUF2442 domain-containing protein [bacterium]